MFVLYSKNKDEENMIVVESKNSSFESIQKKYPNAIIADITSDAKGALVRLSPSFPHGGIPVSDYDYATAYSVEAIWQGLKVFENEDVDTSIFTMNTAIRLKRNSPGLGKMIGHRVCSNGEEILNYADARRRIFISRYRWVLDYKVQDIIRSLRKASETKTIVLLDFYANCEIQNYKEPISCAYLVKAYAEGLPPYEDAFETTKIYHFRTNGRREWTDVSEKRLIKPVPVYKKSNQLKLPLDYKVF